MTPTKQPVSHQVLFEVDGFTAEMCIEKESLDLAYRLRYKAYLNAGAIQPNAAMEFVDHFDLQNNARTFFDLV